MEMGTALSDAFSLWRKNIKGLVLPALVLTAVNLVSLGLGSLPGFSGILSPLLVPIYIIAVLVYDYYLYSKFSGQRRSFLGFLAVSILSGLPAIVYLLVILVLSLLSLLHPVMSVVLVLFLVLGLIPLIYYSLRLTLAKPLFFLRSLDSWPSVREAWDLSRGRVLHLLGFSILAGIVAVVPVILVILLLSTLTLLPTAFFLTASPKTTSLLAILLVTLVASEWFLTAVYSLPFLAAAWLSYTRHLISSL